MANQSATRTSSGPRRIPDAQAVRTTGQQAKSSLVAPVVRFSSVVWLQVTGVFFGMVALMMGTAAWKAREGLHAAVNSSSAIKAYSYVGVCALFTYFTVSSFTRAARK